MIGNRSSKGRASWIGDRWSSSKEVTGSETWWALYDVQLVVSDQEESPSTFVSVFCSQDGGFMRDAYVVKNMVQGSVQMSKRAIRRLRRIVVLVFYKPPIPTAI